MKRALLPIGALALLASGAVAALPSQAADHLDAPLVQDDGRTDINDLYAFQSPQNPDNAVMIMTVNPGAGAISGTTFDSKAWYELRADSDGDRRDEVRYNVSFGRVRDDGRQRVAVYGPDASGKRRYLGRGFVGEDIDLRGGGKLRAGVYDDPFFFDLAAFQNDLAFCSDGTGTDFFAGLNVSAIVLEVPRTSFPSDQLGVRSRTIDKRSRKVIDRMGRPAINTVLIDSANKDAFNQSKPFADQQKWRSTVVASLEGLGNDTATAEALADVLLPDLLTVDFSSTAGFLNGRQLADDVIDAELALITGGGVPGDCVDANDRAFSDSFPYLAEAN